MRKVMGSADTSKRIGSLHLERAVLVAACARVFAAHLEYSAFRTVRVPGAEDSLCLYQFVVLEGPVNHAFSVAYDDATSPDHLFVRDIQYTKHGG